MNLRTLTGQTVFLDDTKLTDTVDKNYYISTLRQQLLANGCDLRDKRDDADFIVEARAGAIGTDRNDLLFGIPSMNVPQIPLVQPVPAAIPEIPIAKRKDQRGIAKIAVFAYHRATGTPVWQSGIVCQESSSNDVWIFGAGPFQHGTIYEGTEFAGETIKNDAERWLACRPASDGSCDIEGEPLYIAAAVCQVSPATGRRCSLLTKSQLPPPQNPAATPAASAGSKRGHALNRLAPPATAAFVDSRHASWLPARKQPLPHPRPQRRLRAPAPATKPTSPPPPAAFANVGDSSSSTAATV